MYAFVYGFSLGFSLILAIGAQNAFVLKQGLKQKHVFLVCLICAVSDAILILVGVSGFHLLLLAFPGLTRFALIGGAAFLTVYGAISFYQAFRLKQGLEPSEVKAGSWLQAALTCLAFTWLNPHVYLDTMVLIGSVSTRFETDLVFFSSGAVLASFIFFFSLGYGARLLRPFFATPRAWRILDFLIGCVMWGIALRLVFLD